MSVVDSTFPNRNHNTLSIQQAPGWLSLHNVLKESLKKAQKQVDNLQLIIRCEELPHIKAAHDEMLKLFDDLLGMILNHAPKSSRLFLYVDCDEERTDVIDMSASPESKRYLIKFNTNIITHENWKLVNSQALVSCRQILSRHNGNLVVNDISSTGCLFLLSLPGKFE
jgi:hypothetical protein